MGGVIDDQEICGIATPTSGISLRLIIIDFYHFSVLFFSVENHINTSSLVMLILREQLFFFNLFILTSLLSYQTWPPILKM